MDDAEHGSATPNEFIQSSTFYRTLAANLPFGAVFVVDRDLRYQLADGQALTAAGLTPADLEGKLLREAIEPDLVPIYEAHYRQALAGQPFRVEHQNHGRTYDTHGVPLRDASGVVQGVLATSYDITERKRVEDALRASEARFRTLADVLPQLIWTNDANGRAVYFNQRWHDYTGLTYQQSAGLGWQAIVHPDDAAAAVAHWRRVLAAGETFDVEYRLRRADGIYRWHIGRNVPLRDDTGQVVSWFGTATDIEDMKQAQNDVRESEERFRMLVEGARDYAMFLMDASRRIVHWNSGASRLFGYSPQEAIGQLADMVFTPEDRAAHKPDDEIRTALRTGRAADRRWHLRRDGSRFWTDGLMMSLRNDLGQLRGFVKIARDATREREAEEALREAHNELEVHVAERTAELQESREQLRQLSVHTEQTREAERTRIAREVHDELGGGLTGLKMQVGALVWGREDDIHLRMTLSDVEAYIDQMVETVRRIGADLRPPILDDLGLLPAMEWHAAEWCRRSNSDCTLDLLDTEPPLNRDQRTAIFRVFQEALTNVARHANAKRVIVTMALLNNELLLTIEDDGIGIKPEAALSTDSLGLMGMQERMREVGGTVEIEGQADLGTTVDIHLPLTPPDKSSL